MSKSGLVLIIVGLATFSSQSQAASNTDFKLALTDHPGQLHWSAEGFKVIQSSAKANGHEIGIRGKDASGRLTFLGFLFLFPEHAPLTSTKCRDGVLDPEKKSNPNMKVIGTSEIVQPSGPPISLTNYTEQEHDGKLTYRVRGFVATGDICGDLEFYSATPIGLGDEDLKKVFSTYRLDENYFPQFNDLLLYGQILYDTHMYKAAAPVFEKALTQVKQSPDPTTWTRVVTDQAGMAYGISGNIQKARALFLAAIARDPDYPLYYYNLACADAEQNNLADARKHLQEAFARKANVVSGESVPDPTKDDSFTRYRDNKDFWKFLEDLQGKQ